MPEVKMLKEETREDNLAGEFQLIKDGLTAWGRKTLGHWRLGQERVAVKGEGGRMAARLSGFSFQFFCRSGEEDNNRVIEVEVSGGKFQLSRTERISSGKKKKVKLADEEREAVVRELTELLTSEKDLEVRAQVNLGLGEWGAPELLGMPRDGVKLELGGRTLAEWAQAKGESRAAQPPLF